MEKFDKRNILKDKLHQKIAEARIKSNPIGPNAERKIQKDNNIISNKFSKKYY
jgi:hypothetical protein